MRSMPRSAAATVTAALALAILGMPGVALAGGPDAPGARGAAAADESRPAPTSSAAADASGRVPAAFRATPTASPTPAATALPFVGPRAQEVVARKAPQTKAPQAKAPQVKAPQAKAAPTQAPQARPAEPAARPATPAAVRPSSPTTPATGKAGRTATAPAAAPISKGDPRGNNGTFKVDGPVLDTSHGNEPHVSCAFRLNLFGYDAGQLGRIAFTAVAPTPGATTRVDGLPLISASSAKGGRYDGSYPVAGTLSAGDLGLDPAVAHHVKVRVEAVNADGSEVPGGAKTKVFWLEPCAAAAAAEVPVPAAEAAPVAAPAGGPVFGPRAVVAAPAATHAETAGTAVLSGGVSAQSVAPSTVVAAPALLLPQGVGAATARPAALPFTGSPQLLMLLMAGLATLAGGSALLVAVRRTS